MFNQHVIDNRIAEYNAACAVERFRESIGRDRDDARLLAKWQAIEEECAS